MAGTIVTLNPHTDRISIFYWLQIGIHRCGTTGEGFDIFFLKKKSWLAYLPCELCLSLLRPFEYLNALNHFVPYFFGSSGFRTFLVLMDANYGWWNHLDFRAIHRAGGG